jgi:hypothetical protein
MRTWLGQIWARRFSLFGAETGLRVPIQSVLKVKSRSGL